MNKTQIIKELKETFERYSIATIVIHADGIGKRAEITKDPKSMTNYIENYFDEGLKAYKNKNIEIKSFEIRVWEKARVEG